MIDFTYLLKNVRANAPLVHNITNYVTVNDVANILLACGASPIMADDVEDATEITGICGGLNINIGTLNHNTIPAMRSAGQRANELSHPVVLDPVGVGASTLRTNTVRQLMEEVHFTVIKGNISEIKTLALGSGTTKGVDADVTDTVTDDTLTETAAFAKRLAKETGAVIAITGAIDLVADEHKAVAIRNGCPEMSKITGSGCMLSALITAFVTANVKMASDAAVASNAAMTLGTVAANKEMAFDATVAAVCAMGICGEKARARMKKDDGNASFRNYLIDAVYRLDGDALQRGAIYEMCE